MQYDYKMVQIPPTIEVRAKEARGQEAAFYLEQVVMEWARRGWEFYRVDTLGILNRPGCLAALFGIKSTLIEYFVVTFRRLKS